MTGLLADESSALLSSFFKDLRETKAAAENTDGTSEDEETTDDADGDNASADSADTESAEGTDSDSE